MSRKPDAVHFHLIALMDAITNYNKGEFIFECDLTKSVCFLARKDAGEGEVVLFDSKEDAEEWVNSSGEIDAELWDINYTRFDL